MLQHLQLARSEEISWQYWHNPMILLYHRDTQVLVGHQRWLAIAGDGSSNVGGLSNIIKYPPSIAGCGFIQPFGQSASWEEHRYCMVLLSSWVVSTNLLDLLVWSGWILHLAAENSWVRTFMTWTWEFLSPLWPGPFLDAAEAHGYHEPLCTYIHYSEPFSLMIYHCRMNHWQWSTIHQSLISHQPTIHQPLNSRWSTSFGPLISDCWTIFSFQREPLSNHWQP